MKKHRKLNIANVGLKGIPVTIGGPENFVENIATRLVERGHNVTVYVRPYSMDMWLKSLPSDKRPERKRVMYYKGIRLITLPTLPKKNLDAIFHTFISAIHALFQPYDVINYHTIGATMVAFVSWMRPSTKTVCSCHGLDWARAKWNPIARRILKFGEYTSARWVDYLQSVSKILKKYYDDKYGIESVYIPTGVEFNEPAELDIAKKHGLEKEKYLLFLSRLVPEKGAHFLIEAYKKLKTDMKLVIAGSSLYGQEYIDELHAMGNENIIFTGFVSEDEMAELFSNAYVYVLPSVLEGLPHSVLQALSYGRCVVTSHIDSSMEALGDCGYTFEVTNPESLREILQKLIENPEIVHAEREKAVARVRSEYDWEIVVDRFEELFYRCIHPGTRSRNKNFGSCPRSAYPT